MTKPLALIPWAPGTNCHHETAYAFEVAGARAEIKPLKKLIEDNSLGDCDLLAFPGGFSWGDHFGSGRIEALDLSHRCTYSLARIMERRIPIIGICNGFQLLVNLGLLPGGQDTLQPTAALDINLSGRFEHWHDVRLVLHEPLGADCVWTKGFEGKAISLPVGHGEGRLVVSRLGKLNVIATFGTAEGDDSYPISPNGSKIAGICDPSGRIMGMMPHPERRIDDLHGGSDGLLIFKAGVDAVR